MQLATFLLDYACFMNSSDLLQTYLDSKARLSKLSLADFDSIQGFSDQELACYNDHEIAAASALRSVLDPVNRGNNVGLPRLRLHELPLSPPASFLSSSRSFFSAITILPISTSSALDPASRLLRQASVEPPLLVSSMLLSEPLASTFSLSGNPRGPLNSTIQTVSSPYGTSVSLLLTIILLRASLKRPASLNSNS